MIAVNWIDKQQTILCQTFTKFWNWHEYEHANHVTYEMLKTVNHTVDIIMDLGDEKMIPWEAFSQIESTTLTHPHPNQGLKIGVTTKDFIDFVKLFKRLYPKYENHIPIHFVETLQDAHQLINYNKFVKST